PDGSRLLWIPRPIPCHGTTGAAEALSGRVHRTAASLTRSARDSGGRRGSSTASISRESGPYSRVTGDTRLPRTGTGGIERWRASPEVDWVPTSQCSDPSTTSVNVDASGYDRHPYS